MKTILFTLLAAAGAASAHIEPYDQVQEGAPLEVQAQDIRTTTDFYAHLAPHGRWLNVPPYGLVWQPNAAVTTSGWHPYCDEGHWVWTDRGWYWHSSYSWGWGPFHYGRWYLCPDRGWYWVPDTVWAPAWVHWRYSDSYLGWAPLPPGATFEIGVGLHFGGCLAPLDCQFGLSYGHYTFVDHRQFLSPNLRMVITSRHNYPAICRGTTVITHGLRCSGSRVVHYGLPMATVGSAGRRSVQLHRIVDRRPTATFPQPSYTHTYNRVPTYRRSPTVVTRPSPVYYSTPRTYYSTPRTQYSYGGGSRHTTVVQSPVPSRPSSSTRTYSSPAPAPSRSSSSSGGSSRTSSPRTTVSLDAGRRSDRMKHIVKRR